MGSKNGYRTENADQDQYGSENIAEDAMAMICNKAVDHGF
jgi:hypothetical protein